MMRKLLLPLRLLYCFYAFCTFFLCMLLVVPLVIGGSFFGKIKGGNFIYRICCYWGDVWFFLIGIRHRNRREAEHGKSEQYIYVANHISYLDAPLIVKTIRKPLRVLGKVEMAKIPVFGYIYRNAIVTVDRSSAENRSKSVRVLKSVLNKGISILIFPEGTFNTTHQPLKSFYDGAFRIAIETQTPIKPVLFLDGYARMPYEHWSLLNPGRSRSVILDTVSVEGMTLRDLESLKNRVFSLMEERLIHYKASWIVPGIQAESTMAG